MKIKNLIVLFVIGLVLFSCKKDDDNSDDFDAVAQEVIDNEALITYLQTHYLNEEDGGIWTITNGETPLMDNIGIQEVEEEDITYKLYYYIENGGVGRTANKLDSVMVDYTGMLLDSTVFDSRESQWFDLMSILYSNPKGAIGFAHGLENLKEGEVKINEDESFDFIDSGKGFFFLPSGLGYKNRPSGVIEANSPMIFQMTLKRINESDHDNDGVLTKDEDANGDGDPTNDDSNANGIPDYLDKDTK